MTAWGVRYARQFHEQLMALGDTTYARVEASIDVLASNPGLARPYVPSYEAARPPVPCRCYPVPRTTKVIYLVEDETSLLLTMLFLGDAREDPMRRFDRMT
jgi:hypothetical protein